MRGRRVEVGVPGVQVRVEVHQRDRAVRADHRPQHGQRDRVVAADRDDLPVALQQVPGVPGDLRHGLVDRERRHRHIPGVDHLDGRERAGVQLDVMAGSQVPGGLPDRHRTEPGSRPVGGAVVERGAEHGDVVVGDPVDFGKSAERTRPGEPGHLPAIHRTERLTHVPRHCGSPIGKVQARVRVTPPLGCSICPTTALDPRPARKATAAAMSSALASLRTGICSA